jgi:hypothetical protein
LGIDISLAVFLLGVSLARAAPSGAVDLNPGTGKIIAVSQDHSATKLFVEAYQPLISGGVVYVGPNKIPAVLGTSIGRTDQHFIYSASAEAQSEIKIGDEVSLDPPPAAARTSKLSLNFNEQYTFEQKRVAAISAVQGGRAMINRGSMSEVHEKDLYRVYDSSGHYKGLLELSAVGDTQASGALYNALEDRHRGALTTAEGDKAVFAGQRKFLGLGFIGGVRSSNDTVITQKESTFAFGLLWDTTFRDGLGLEVLFGGFTRDGQESAHLNLTGGNGAYEQVTHQSAFFAPIWVKKNFFYPSPVSPFVAAGGSLLTALNSYHYQVFSGPNTLSSVDGSKKLTTIEPVVGAGLEFCQGYFFRPRLEVRYFFGPKVTVSGNVYDTASLYYSAGFVMAW